VAPGGRVVVVGQSSTPAAVATFLLVQRRLTIRGCLIYDHPGGFARTIAAVSERDLRPGRVLRARFAVADAGRAFAEAAGLAGKTWITFEERTG
jgi:threonine dehydrogenase-like Zn-dependent dehydrogenase